MQISFFFLEKIFNEKDDRDLSASSPRESYGHSNELHSSVVVSGR